MKKITMLLMLLSLGLFTIGCSGPAADSGTDASTTDQPMEGESAEGEGEGEAATDPAEAPVDDSDIPEVTTPEGAAEPPADPPADPAPGDAGAADPPAGDAAPADPPAAPESN